MKQIRLIGVWLMCWVIGLSVSSCLKGQDDNLVTMTGLVRAEGTSFYDNAGLELKPSNPQQELSGHMVYIQFTYDKSQLKQDAKTLSINLHAMSTPIAIQAVTLDDGTSVGNAAIYDLNGGRTNSNELGYLFWNKNILVFPTTVFHKGRTTDEAKADAVHHTYKLMFDRGAGFDDGVLTLRFCHSVSDAQGEEVARLFPGRVNHAFDLSNVFSTLPTGVKTIKLVVEENDRSDKKSEAQVKTYEFKYPFAQ